LKLPHAGAGAGAGAQPPLLNRSSVVIRHNLNSRAMFGYLISSRKTIPHVMASGGIGY